MANRSLKERVSTQIALTKEEVERGVPAIETALATMAPEFQIALPEGIDPAQFTRDIITYTRKVPKLALCEKLSVLGAFTTAAQLGLRVGVSALGQAYVLPFWNKSLVVGQNENGTPRRGGLEATFVIGYPGMIELMNRSGKLQEIQARTVRHGEPFDIEFGTSPVIYHKPLLDEEPGDIRGFYYVLKTSTGGTLIDYWSLKKMEAHRDRFATTKSKEGKVFGPWVDHFEAMALKTMVRAAFKLAPKSTELAVALDADGTVRRDTNPQLALEQLADVTEHAEDLAGEIPDNAGIPDDFKHDESPGAPSREEQWLLYQQEQQQ